MPVTLKFHLPSRGYLLVEIETPLFTPASQMRHQDAPGGVWRPRQAPIFGQSDVEDSRHWTKDFQRSSRASMAAG